MSVANPEESGENAPSESDLLIAFEKADQSREDLFAAVGTYVNKPTDEHKKLVTELTSKNISNVADMFIVVFNEMEVPLSEKAGIIAGFLLSEDSIRVTRLKTIVPTADVTAVSTKNDDMQHYVEQLLESDIEDSEVASQLLAQYVGNMQIDFKEALPEVKEKRSAQIQKLAGEVGKHALDVVKIGIGAGIAIAAWDYYSKDKDR